MSKSTNVLLVDDDIIFRTTIAAILMKAYNIIEASDFESGLAEFNNNIIHLAVLDINYEKNKNGIDLLKEIKKNDSSLPVVMLSDSSSVDVIVESMKIGAYDYISKSNFNLNEELRFRIENALKRNIKERTFESLKKNFKSESEIITQNKEILQALDEIKSIGEMNLLIEGETGVGKTPIAKYANQVLKSTGDRPFVRINCAGLSKERLQDEMFGHKKGAFTSADIDKNGLVEVAKGGDLFLDEIGDLNLECQAELLVYLDSYEYRRLGETMTRYAECRVISATNKNLHNMIKKNEFRRDLYSRISQCKVIIPPLRDRKEDILPIVKYYIKEFEGYEKKYSAEILTMILNYEWSEGNVRELKDTVKYLCQKSKNDETITIDHINPKFIFNKNDLNDLSFEFIGNVINEDDIKKFGYENYLSNIENIMLLKLAEKEKTIKAVAEKVSLPTTTVFRKMKKYAISL
ncbi:MAG: sigma-54 dependent transcriptional regulator [Pseudomonadota bacterium]